jgi:hypothetical protein
LLCVICGKIFLFLCFLKVLEPSPFVAIAMIESVALGWVFFVRWGGSAGAIFFCVAAGYGLLQLPAYLSVAGMQGLDFAFSLLAGGKILIAFGFLSLLCSSSIPEIKIEIPKYWPTKPVPPPRWMLQLVGWGVTAVVGFATSILTDPLKTKVQQYLGFLSGS